jgi:branched-chain amino acid transport system substrate-binding protein
MIADARPLGKRVPGNATDRLEERMVRRSIGTPGLGRALIGAVLIACLALVVQGCGSSSSESSSAATEIFPNKGGAVSSKDAEVASRFVGGTPGKADKSPITIGLITNEGGPIPPGPGKTVVFAAEKLINEKLGGIDGHPIRLLQCATGASEEQAQACGQKFVNDPAVKAVLDPGESVGGLALLGAIGGQKVEICAVPTQPELFGTNVFCPTGGVISTNAAITYLSEHASVNSVAQLLPDSEVFRQIGEVGVKQMEAEGLKVSEGFVPLESPDVISSVVASGAQNADAIYLTLTSPSQCIAVAEALESLGVADSTTVISLPSCADPTVAEALGDLPHWTFFDVGESPNLPEPNPEVQAYLDSVKTYGDGQSGTFSTAIFGTTLWMARVLQEAWPNLSTANIAAKARAFKGPMFLGAPDIAFGQAPWRNAGTLDGRFFRYEGNGKWVDATGGEWIEQPPPVK